MSTCIHWLKVTVLVGKHPNDHCDFTGCENLSRRLSTGDVSVDPVFYVRWWIGLTEIKFIVKGQDLYIYQVFLADVKK